MLATTAQPYSLPPQQQEFLSQPELYPQSDSISASNPFFFPSVSLPAGASDTATVPDQVLPSPTDDVPSVCTKQEEYPESDIDDEQFSMSMFSGQPYATSYSRAYDYTEQALPLGLNVDHRTDLPREFASGNGTSDAVPVSVPVTVPVTVPVSVPLGVTAGQANNGNLETCENMKIKIEHPVPPRQKPTTTKTPKKAKPVPVHAIESSPLPPGIELPAILGGKLPPRTFKTKSKKHVYTERELKSRRKRGLADDSDSESEERRQVRLPRRSLLTITTPQMSQFVTFMRTNLELTPSQQDELSRQKRLVKNRESASRFRAKKVLTLIEYRDRLMELEGDLVTLRMENERLRKELANATSSSSSSSSSQSVPTLPETQAQCS